MVWNLALKSLTSLKNKLLTSLLLTLRFTLCSSTLKHRSFFIFQTHTQTCYLCYRTLHTRFASLCNDEEAHRENISSLWRGLAWLLWCSYSYLSILQNMVMPFCALGTFYWIAFCFESISYLFFIISSAGCFGSLSKASSRKSSTEVNFWIFSSSCRFCIDQNAKFGSRISGCECW